MSPLALFAVRMATLEVRPALRRVKRTAIGYAIIAALVALAIVFGLVAAYDALSEAAGGTTAGLILAAIFAVLAGGVWATLAVIAARERARARKRSPSSAALAAAAVAVLPALLKSRTALIAALPIAVVGYLVFAGGTGSDPDD